MESDEVKINPDFAFLQYRTILRNKIKIATFLSGYIQQIRHNDVLARLETKYGYGFMS